MGEFDCLQVENDLERGFDACHEILFKRSYSILQARFAYRPNLFANNNSVDCLASHSGGNRNVAGVNSLLVSGVSYGADADDGTVLV